MNLDDLKNTWQQEVKTLDANVELSTAIAKLEQETTKFDRHLFWRDMRENVAAIILIPIWVYGLMDPANWVEALGLVILLAACIVIPVVMWCAKPKENSKLVGIKDFLQFEKDKMEKQIKLLDKVLLWYIAPIYTGVMLVVFGTLIYERGISAVDTNMWLYVGIVTLLSIGIYFMNKHAARKKYHPLMDKINQQLTELEQA